METFHPTSLLELSKLSKTKRNTENKSCPEANDLDKPDTSNDYFHKHLAMLSTFPILYIVFLYASFRNLPMRLVPFFLTISPQLFEFPPKIPSTPFQNLPKHLPNTSRTLLNHIYIYIYTYVYQQNITYGRPGLSKPCKT